jgi:prepilin-type N-terminal cleavage/methylation domain-containing protein/prepilin-type processing-associated H-X9-DG protein
MKAIEIGFAMIKKWYVLRRETKAPAQRRAAFTLVELLVVIAIIGILVALLLPAIQAAREAARRSQCKNGVKNIALGCLLHVDSHKFLPSGGWTYQWSADPNQGNGADQPGSWAYNILPYVEEQALHDLGKGLTPGTAPYNTALAQLNTTPVGLFICPSRRPVQLYRGNWTAVAGEMSFLTALSTGAGVAKSDYAANAGSSRKWDGTELGASVLSYATAKTYKWPRTGMCTRGGGADFANCQNGISYIRSEVKLSMIPDGTSSTYLVGEKYLATDQYESSANSFAAQFGLDDNQGIYVGYDWDMYRVAFEPRNHPVTGTPGQFPESGGTLVPGQNSAESYLPQQDRPGTQTVGYAAFGSAHVGGLNMSFCDGSVRTISYDTDGWVHRNMANRMDAELISERQ